MLRILSLITSSPAQCFAGDQAESKVPEHRGTALVASLLYFASIVSHEFGYRLVALRCSMDVKRITLFLFGGMLELGLQPRWPRDEIAIVPPLASVAVGLCFGALALQSP